MLIDYLYFDIQSYRTRISTISVYPMPLEWIQPAILLFLNETCTSTP